MKTHSSPEESATQPNSAVPGTPEYDAQFEQQAAAAMAAAWKMTLVRLCCGFGAIMLALLVLGEVVRFVLGETDDPLMSIAVAFSFATGSIWLTRVAISGKTPSS